MGSPDGSSPDLDKLGGRSSTLEDKVNDIVLRLAQLLALAQSVSKFDSHVQTLTVLSTRIAGIEENVTTLAARIFASEAGHGSASDLRTPSRILALAWTRWWFHCYTGPVTQLQRTTTGICDENSKQTPMMKTRAAPFACASHARKVMQAFPRGSLKEFQHRRKSTKSNARAAARRLELSMPPKPCASDSWHNSRMMAVRYSVDSFLQRYRYNPCLPVQNGGVSRRWASLWASPART